MRRGDAGGAQRKRNETSDWRPRMATTTAPTSTGTASDGWLTPAQMRTLEALCDALIPAVAPPPGADDAHGLYARTAREGAGGSLAARARGGAPTHERQPYRHAAPGLLRAEAAGQLHLLFCPRC